jgi:hypothetical protein
VDALQLPAWLQAGGIVAFAGAVWFELRQQRRTLETLTKIVAALLERDRIRGGTGPIQRLPSESDEDADTLSPPFRR